jgi:Stress responsive A/B Barrel Domain
MPRIAGMKTILVVAALLIGITALGGATGTMGENKVLRHVVLFKFKEGTTAEQVKQVEDAFRALPGRIKQVKGFEWGTNVSPENLAQGYTHCFLLTFSSDHDRDAYLVDPAHKEFGNVLKPYLEKVLVVDFWVKE